MLALMSLQSEYLDQFLEHNDKDQSSVISRTSDFGFLFSHFLSFSSLSFY
jgi:hypothetical protein